MMYLFVDFNKDGVKGSGIEWQIWAVHYNAENLSVIGRGGQTTIVAGALFGAAGLAFAGPITGVALGVGAADPTPEIGGCYERLARRIILVSTSNTKWKLHKVDTECAARVQIMETSISDQRCLL